MKAPLTSRELLAATGVPTEDKPEIPAEYLTLLITSVIKCVASKKFQAALNQRGYPVSLREVHGWQHATREWLGLPDIGRGKPSDEYRNEIKKWLQNHGNPTLEDIDAGWVPAHHREKESVRKQLSPSAQRHIEEFRGQVALLNAAENDDEVKRLLTQFMEEMGRAWQIPLLAKQTQTVADNAVCIQEESLPLETSSGSEASPDDSFSEPELSAG